MQNKIQILSTKKISKDLIALVGENNICIDELNFIETRELISEEIRIRILELSKQNIIAVFTSSNAVNSVGKLVSSGANWKIFCIEAATKKTVESIFNKFPIAGTAKDAAELSQKIIKDNSAKQVVFFCGNQRRDLLPAQLKNNGIDVEELVVYETIETPKHVSKTYDSVLFFSPSAVRSFFANNTLPKETTIFSIGGTTAKEINHFSKNKIIVSKIPDTQKLISEVIRYFSTLKTV